MEKDPSKTKAPWTLDDDMAIWLYWPFERREVCAPWHNSTMQESRNGQDEDTRPHRMKLLIEFMNEGGSMQIPH